LGRGIVVLVAGIPTIREWDMPESPEATANYMAAQSAGATNRPCFLWARTILTVLYSGMLLGADPEMADPRVTKARKKS